MLELPHAVVGATIAVLIQNPAISIPLSLASHFIMDLYPHWNPSLGNEYKKYGRISPGTTLLLWMDSILALVVGLTLAKIYWPNYYQSLNVILCCFMAVLPDVIEIPVVIFRQKHHVLKKLNEFESKFQTKLAAPAGIISQLIVLAICFILIFRTI